MKRLNNITPAFLLATALLLVAFTLPGIASTTNTNSSDSIYTHDKAKHQTITQQEANSMLAYYAIGNQVKIKHYKVKIYSSNNELVYSASVCKHDFECDERLNLLINQSDFITEVDDTRIYFLRQ